MRYVIVVEGESPTYVDSEIESLSSYIKEIGLEENKFISIITSPDNEKVINTRYIKKIYKSIMN